MLELLLPLGWALALSPGGAVAGGLGPTPAAAARRGPHHPREEPLPPGVLSHHHHRSPSDKLTHDAQLMHDTAHLQEDLGRPLEEMTDEELEFHYFKLHDFDSNTLLDGLEMLKAIYHTMDHGHEVEISEEENATGTADLHTTTSPQPFVPSEEEMNRYIELIDKVLEEDDLDHDGYLSYPEFALGRLGGKALNMSPKSVVRV